MQFSLVLTILFAVLGVYMFGAKLFSGNFCGYFKSVIAMSTAPAVFVNHGGGPLPLLGDKNTKPLTEFLKNDVKKHVDFGKIKAIILVTAHWDADVVTISGSEKHDLYFDYYGFPEVSYTYKYNAPGHPGLASRLKEKLKEHGIDSEIDNTRGWDHGVFVPMMLIRPEADIPIVQMSVLVNQDAEEHWKIGAAISEFRSEGVAVFGSGMSYHNMREFFTGRGAPKGRVINEPFDTFLNEACTKGGEGRKNDLLHWRERDGAFEAHPARAAEHFMPLIVIAGAGGESKGERIMSFDYMNKFKLSSFIWK